MKRSEKMADMINEAIGVKIHVWIGTFAGERLRVSVTGSAGDLLMVRKEMVEHHGWEHTDHCDEDDDMGPAEDFYLAPVTP